MRDIIIGNQQSRAGRVSLANAIHRCICLTWPKHNLAQSSSLLFSSKYQIPAVLLFKGQQLDVGQELIPASFKQFTKTYFLFHKLNNYIFFEQI